MRCAYAWYLQERGEVAFDETVSPYQRELIADGQQFHTTTEAALQARRVPSRDLAAAIRQIPERPESELWIPTEVLEDPGRKIYGLPDAIIPAGGALIPVEIKSHRISSRMDQIELAFYWLLLEGQRTSGHEDPHGVLLLRQRDGASYQVEVGLEESDFDNVMTYIGRVRYGRLNGVRPRVCRCQLCRGSRRHEVLAAAHEVEDVTLINGIAVPRADRLTEIGIYTWRHLLATEAEEIRACLATHRDHVGLREIGRWKHHARAYDQRAPVTFGPAPQIGTKFIALDLEYVNASQIWLAGVAIVDDARIEYHLIWSATAGEQRDGLLELVQLLQEHTGLPLVTWAGESADVPVLRAALAAAGLPGLLDNVLATHIDLYQHALRSRRWPIPELGLKQLCELLKIDRVSTVRDGLQAQALYYQMTASTDPEERKQLRDRLGDYCRDDLDGLIEIARRFATDVYPMQEMSVPPSPRGNQTDPDFVPGLLRRIENRLIELKDAESRLSLARAALVGPSGMDHRYTKGATCAPG